MKAVYVGYFLDGLSRSELLRLVPPRHSTVHADHCTAVFKPTVEVVQSYPVGSYKVLRVVGVVSDDKGQAVLVAGARSDNAHPHITISCADGIKAVYSNELFERGKIEYFDEPIRLVAICDTYPRQQD